jgi:hypothetical protein
VLLRVVLTGARHEGFRIALDYAEVSGGRVLAEGMACGFVASQLWDSRIVLRGVSSIGVYCRGFSGRMFLYMRVQPVGCSCHLQVVLERFEVRL